MARSPRLRQYRLLAAILAGFGSPGCAPTAGGTVSANLATAVSHVILWRGIPSGADPDALRGLVFEDARHITRKLSHRFDIDHFYLHVREPANVRVIFAGKPRRSWGVDIEGTNASEELAELLATFGQPQSTTSQDLWDSPGGSAMLNDGGKRFTIRTWVSGSLRVTLADRVRGGFFRISYRCAER